jgi:hypothetical protein
LASDCSILFFFAVDEEREGLLDALVRGVASPTSNDLSGDEELESFFDAGFPASASNTGTIDGGFGTIGRLTVEQDDMVTKLMDVMGIQDVDYAREFLQRNGWQLDNSVNAYLSMGMFSTGDSRHLPLYNCRNT